MIDGMSEVALAELRSLSAPVRADCLRILEAVVPAVTRRWRRRTGVPLLWLTLPPGDDPEVHVEPTDLYELAAANGYLDEFRVWSGPAVYHRLDTSRCAALVYGDRVHAHMWGPFSIGAGWWAPDSFVAVRIGHQVGRNIGYHSLGFSRRGVLWQRIRFDDGVHELFAAARRL